MRSAAIHLWKTPCSFGAAVAILAILASTNVCQASDPSVSTALSRPASADGPPTNLVPWHAGQPQDVEPRRSLIDQLQGRDQRYDTKTWPQPPRLQLKSPLNPRTDQKSLRRGRERLGFVHLDSPLGRFSLISRDIDQQGRIRDINFLSFDDPNSNWEMGLKVHHGAMFELTRKWGAHGAPGPFVPHNKSSQLFGDR